MAITVRPGDSRHVSVTEEVIETDPPNRVTFAAEGTITVTGELIGGFAGTSLDPVEVGISVDGSRTVDIDLTGDATLRLDTVDVGVETPGAGDLSPGMDAASDGESESADDSPGAIAFTLEGAIGDVRGEAVETIAGGDPSLESTTFDVGGAVETDGGVADDVLLEVRILGYGVAVYRNGSIAVDTGGTPDGVGLR